MLNLSKLNICHRLQIKLHHKSSKHFYTVITKYSKNIFYIKISRESP